MSIKFNINAKDVISNFYFKENTKKLKIIKKKEKLDYDLDNSQRCNIFLDLHKMKNKYWMNMFDTFQGPLPLSTTKPCRWCHLTYTTIPLGCPVKYHSNISEDDTSIVHKIWKDRFLSYLKEMNLNNDSTEFFETVGKFCGFCCIKGYIIEQIKKNKNSIYKNSLSLLTLMYIKYNLLETTMPIVNIPIALPHTSLILYDGHLTVEKYREQLGNFSYTETPNIKRPLLFSCSEYLKEIKYN